MESQIFGSDIRLPSLPGLQSDCENEIILLMREVDLEFQNRHQALLDELITVRKLCKAQTVEIENMRFALQSSNEAIQNENLKEKVKEHCKEIEKLKKENKELKTENCALKSKAQKLQGCETQLESFRRSFAMQQDENKALTERLSKTEQEYQSLQNNYARVMNGFTSMSQIDGNQGTNKVNGMSPLAPTEAEIAQIAEKFLSEEDELCKDFLSKSNQSLEDLNRRLSKELS